MELFASLGVHEYKNLMVHSLQVAKISRHLARSLGLAHHPDQVYLVGLLHDVGLIFKLSIENYEVFIDAFRNIPDLEKIVLTLDRKDRHSFISHVVASHLGFLNVDCTQALLYHHTPFDEISDEEGVALLANCIKAADTISLVFLKSAEMFSEVTLESMIKSLEKDMGLNQEVRKATIDSLKDVRSLVDLLDSETHFNSDAKISCADFERAAKLTAALLDLRSPYTRIHTFSVARIAKQLTSQLMTEIDQRFMGIAALFHDLGKITTPLEILHKRGSLNEIETIVMRTHVVMTEKVLLKSGLDMFHAVSASHHERLDGSGYPRGLDRSQINMYMRILQISDVFSALTEERPYRKAMAPFEALKVIENGVRDGKLDGIVFEKLKQLIDNGFTLETFSHVLEDIFGPDLTNLVLQEIND
ncbi:HD domain-containing phosphohydrolase [Pseudothermotoga sp.]